MPGANQYTSGHHNGVITTVKTLADYDLTLNDSYHAQALAEHKDIIADYGLTKKGSKKDIEKGGLKSDPFFKCK
jgi:hypothetical protein